MNTKKKQRINISMIIFLFFSLCIFLLYIRFAYLTFSEKIDDVNMSEFAANRNVVKKTISAKRGTIYDSEGNILALNVSSYTLIIALEKSKVYNGENYVKDVEKTASALSSVLTVDKDYLVKVLSQDKYQVELGVYGSGLTELKKDEILALGLSGISFTESQKRYYPNGDFASYIIGYAKTKDIETYDENDVKCVSSAIVGELGIEASYDDQLSGEDGSLEYQQSRYGYKITGTDEIRIDAADGNNIYLTIDSNIQRFVETAVKKIDENYSPEWTVFAVMDAKTGDILGFSTTPSYDPNIKDITNYENPLVTFTFEPGSTMKTYTYMCAMENNGYDGNETYQSGNYTIGEYTINDWNNGLGWGTISFDKGYEYSSNVGVVNLLEKHLDQKKLKECLKKYGFGKKTGIELSRESSGSLDFNYEVEYAAAGYGQGITTTVIQQLQALTLISNNGKMLKPHIISKIVNPNTGKTEYEREIEESEQLVKTSTVDKLKELMYNVIHGTDAGSTGYIYKIDGFNIIGKTGTSQIYDMASGSYLIGDNLYIYSFEGMYPKDDPEIIIYAAMKKPLWGKSSGLYTYTKDVIQSISKYKNMFTEITEKQVETYTVKSYLSKNTDTVKQELIENNIDAIIIGSGNKITLQSVPKNTELTSKDKIILLTNSSDYKMPNLTGFSRTDVITLFNLLNIKYEIEGTGYVVSQNYPEGTPISTDLTINVKLEDKIVAKEVETTE